MVEICRRPKGRAVALLNQGLWKSQFLWINLFHTKYVFCFLRNVRWKFFYPEENFNEVNSTCSQTPINKSWCKASLIIVWLSYNWIIYAKFGQSVCYSTFNKSVSFSRVLNQPVRRVGKFLWPRHTKREVKKKEKKRRKKERK